MKERGAPEPAKPTTRVLSVLSGHQSQAQSAKAGGWRSRSRRTKRQSAIAQPDRAVVGGSSLHGAGCRAHLSRVDPEYSAAAVGCVVAQYADHHVIDNRACGSRRLGTKNKLPKRENIGKTSTKNSQKFATGSKNSPDTVITAQKIPKTSKINRN